MGVEVEVEIDLPEVEFEVEIGDPMVEVEVDAGLTFEVDIEPHVEIHVDIPQVEIQAQALVSTNGMVQIDSAPPKKVQHRIEVDLLRKDPQSVQPFLQKIWVWLAMQAGIPFVTCCILMMLPVEWFAGLLTMPFYDYIWDGIFGFLVICILCTLLKCTQSCFVGFVMWFLILLGSLAVFGMNCMRRLGDEGSASVIFLGILFSMLCGMCFYSRTKNPTYETCASFSYLVVPQVAFSFLVCAFYSYKSGLCIGHMVLITLFALTCKGSARLILDDEKSYATNQSVSASQKMYTDFFDVIGHFLHAFYRKSELPREINYVFN